MKNEQPKTRSSFTGSIGFVLAAAGSAVGLGNIWRFPYIAAKDGGGLFVLCYLILLLTFGFALLLSEVAIGRKTRKGPLDAYREIHPKFGFLGWLATIVPLIIFPYYCVIGGWVTKYGAEYITGARNINAENAGDFFSGFITAPWAPIVFFLIFIGVTALVVFLGVEKGIEKVSKVLMPALLVLIIGIAVFALTLSHEDNGTVRTAWQGLKILLIPDFSAIQSFGDVISIIMDAAAQLFYSVSIAMGIMVAYGSYMPKESNVVKSVGQIELFDTAVAILAGIIIIPSVFVFQGAEGLSASGPSLMFISLPKVFDQMGVIGIIVGALFFLLVFFAALTSSISLMEAIVASIMDRFKLNRKKASLIALVLSLILGLIVCLGYNALYFEYTLPNGAVAQILDIFDYISNNLMMPIVALLTSILIGWVVKTKVVLDEVQNGLTGKFYRKGLYNVVLRYVCPVILVVILLQAFGLFK